MTPGDTKPRPTGAIRIAWAAAQGQRRRLGVVAALSFVGGFAEATVLVIVARLAFAFASREEEIKVSAGPFGDVRIPIPTLLALAASLIVVRLVMQLLQARLSARIGAEMRQRVRAQLIGLYLGASWALQSEERAGRLQEYATTFASTVASSVSTLSMLVVAVSSLSVFVLTALVVNAGAAVAVTVAAVGMGLLLRPLRHRVRQKSGAAARVNLGFAGDVSELAATMQEVRVFDVASPVLRRIRGRIDESARLDRSAAFAASVAPALYQGVALLMIVGALTAVYAADLTRLASFGGILLIVIRSLNYGQATQSAIQYLQATAPSLEILEEERARLAASAAPREGRPLTSIGDIRFEHVSFEYQPGRPVLEDVSFEAPHGEIVGIVGPSGAGKSTLVQLILRLREPTAGLIAIDSEDVREFAQADWFKRVSFVPQDARLFAGTIAENIAFHREDVDQAAVERAARQANLHEEVMATADGYETWVGEGGVRLSGGQRQRLCIARALAEDPDVLVLDEPTSSLDVRSEALIRASVAALSPHTTVFVIAHRLSTLDICDRIMVIYEGRLQGFDTPSRLEENDPFYREALTLSGLR